MLVENHGLRRAPHAEVELNRFMLLKNLMQFLRKVPISRQCAVVNQTYDVAMGSPTAKMADVYQSNFSLVLPENKPKADLPA